MKRGYLANDLIILFGRRGKYREEISFSELAEKELETVLENAGDMSFIEGEDMWYKTLVSYRDGPMQAGENFYVDWHMIWTGNEDSS